MIQGENMEISELILPIIVLGIIILMLVMGLNQRVIAKLGLRNFTRHKGHTVISVAGLLIGTSIICASMVVGDSIEYFIVEETYEGLQLIDVTVEADNGGTFDESIFTILNSNAALDKLTDGMSPLLVHGVSVRQHSSGQFEPSVNVIGFDAVQDEEFGLFIYIDENGNRQETNGDVSGNDTIINRALAQSLDVSVGQELDLTYTNGGIMGYGNIQSRTLTIRYIAEDEGKARYNPGTGMNLDTYNIYVEMDTAQEMFLSPGMINQIKISNNGGVVSGTDGSDAVLETIEPLLEDLTFSIQDEMIFPIPMNGMNLSMLSNTDLVPDSLVLTSNGSVISSQTYRIDHETGTITFLAPPPMIPVFAEYEFNYFLEAEAIKQDNLEMARDINDTLSTFLTIFGSFAILAGVILIINIFTMLAEERKSELGMARAVGMKRRHLMQSFLFEGLAYGTVASAMGTIAGVGIGAFLIYMINNIADIMAGVVIPFHFETFSLITAFSTGFIITNMLNKQWV